MRKIVAKKMYDQQTAELIGEWGNGYNRSDFKWCEEQLYKTKKGSYFIYGEGGPMSGYTETYGNTTTGSEDIRVLTEEEAIEWCQDRQLIEVLEKHFKDSIEEG